MVQDGFLEREILVAGARHAYRVRAPRGGARRAPVLLFLHGAGERGGDNARQLENGLPPQVMASPDDWPFVVVAPQCPADLYWPQPPALALALAALEDAVVALAADGGRVAVTGVSMGGYGSLELGVCRPGRFAALAVVCGGVGAVPAIPDLHAHQVLAAGASEVHAETARRLGDVPVWLFHGADDGLVPVEESRRLAAALRAAGGDVRYTEYPGVQHDCWVRAYAEPELAGWLREKLA